MKAPSFHYHRPNRLDEAIGLLATRENARILAGGQSLVPMMNLRVAAPDHLIDLAAVPGLSDVRDEGDRIVVGAMATQRNLERSDTVRRRLPLVAAALGHVGHPATRSRGTLGGSLCHLDPAAELPLVALALDAEVTAAGPRGERTLPFAAFAVDLMTTALAPDEVLTAVAFRPWADGYGWGFVECAPRHGDFAVAAAAALVGLDARGRIDRAVVALGGVAPTPVRAVRAESALLGARPDPATLADAAALTASCATLDDPLTPVRYRRRVAVAMVGRALADAVSRAVQEADRP